MQECGCLLQAQEIAHFSYYVGFRRREAWHERRLAHCVVNVGPTYRRATLLVDADGELRFLGWVVWFIEANVGAATSLYAIGDWIDGTVPIATLQSFINHLVRRRILSTAHNILQGGARPRPNCSQVLR